MESRMGKIPYWVYDLLSLISSLLAIITSIIALFKVTVKTETSEESTHNIPIKGLLLLLTILFCFAFLVCIIKIKKYGTVTRNMRQAFSKNYYQFLHDFRNEYFYILRKHKKKIKKGKKNRRINELTNETRTFLINALDYLCEILHSDTGQKVCACIKLIENTGNVVTNIDKNKATVITFCRSKNTDLGRLSNDEKENSSIKIKDNTDFDCILNGQSYFYVSDLQRYDKKLRQSNNLYRNTTENYEKYYKGTIVAPIRIKKEHLHYTKEEKGYDIVGFLCVDSLSTSAFRESEHYEYAYSHIVKSFAAEMYIILNKYTFYLSKIDGGK